MSKTADTVRAFLAWVETVKVPLAKRRRRCLHCHPSPSFDGWNGPVEHHCVRCARVLHAEAVARMRSGVP